MSTRSGLVLVREGAAAAQAEHEVQRGLFLYVVVGKGAAVLELLAREDEALLVGRDALPGPPCPESSASRSRSCPTAPRPA